MKVLLDTCVIIDMVDKNQERAVQGKQLYQFLTSNNVEITLLRHSFFEVAEVLKNLKIGKGEYQRYFPFFVSVPFS